MKILIQSLLSSHPPYRTYYVNIKLWTQPVKKEPTLSGNESELLRATWTKHTLILIRFGSSPCLNIIFSCFASMEICDPRNNITMCPLCDHACSYWKLVTACGTARASHLFDNPATVFFSIFMALWGVDEFVFISQKLAYCVSLVHLEAPLALFTLDFTPHDFKFVRWFTYNAVQFSLIPLNLP